jgi:hypothetical protein
MVGAYLLWLGVNHWGKTRFKWMLLSTIVLTLAAIVGVFVEIWIVSTYAFWIMAAAYVFIAASTDIAVANFYAALGSALAAQPGRISWRHARQPVARASLARLRYWRAWHGGNLSPYRC